jgi:glycosyltransferase involved in cell wall biosynthesis
MKKILLVTNIPNNYRIPLFNKLNKLLNADGDSLKVLFAAKSYSRRLDDINMNDCHFDYEILNSKIYSNKNNSEKTAFSYSGLSKKIAELKPDIIIVSGFSAATVKIFLLSFIYKFSYIIWSGSILKKGRTDFLPRIFQRKILTTRSSAFIAYGTKAKAYLQQLGAANNKICIAVNTVDTDFFAKQVFQKKLELPTPAKNQLTSIAYLVPRKKMELLIDVVAELSKLRTDFILNIIGDGESRHSLEKYSADKGLNGYITFHGLKTKEELPYYLAQTTIFLFQTDFDIWGLTLVEAMAAGIACIASVNAAATFDLITEEITGYTADFSETSQVAVRINKLLDNNSELEQIGRNAAIYISKNADLEISASGFLKAIAACK